MVVCQIVALDFLRSGISSTRDIFSRRKEELKYPLQNMDLKFLRQYIHNIYNEYKGTCFGFKSRWILRNKNNGEITSTFFSKHIHVLLVLFQSTFDQVMLHFVRFDLDED